jgi:hypothetical protein
LAHLSQTLRRPPGPRKIRISSLSRGGVRGAGSRALRVIVEHRRVLDQDTVAGFFVERPNEEEIEKDGIVGLLLTFTRLRPVAAPHAAFGRRLRIRLRDRGPIGISRRSDLGVGIGAGQFNPGFAFVDQRADLAEKRVVHSRGFRDVGEVVEHDRRGQFFEDGHDLDDLHGRRVDLNVPPDSFIRFDSGSIISGVVTPPVARLKRMPRAPRSCRRFNSPSDTVSVTTTTARLDPERRDRVKSHAIIGVVSRGLHDDVRLGPMRFWKAS